SKHINGLTNRSVTISSPFCKILRQPRVARASGWLLDAAGEPKGAAPVGALPATEIPSAPLNYAAMTSRRDLFPPIEPYRTGQLRLDSHHVMYWEESGNPE